MSSLVPRPCGGSPEMEDGLGKRGGFPVQVSETLHPQVPTLAARTWELCHLWSPHALEVYFLVRAS